MQPLWGCPVVAVRPVAVKPSSSLHRRERQPAIIDILEEDINHMPRRFFFVFFFKEIFRLASEKTKTEIEKKHLFLRVVCPLGKRKRKD